MQKPHSVRSPARIAGVAIGFALLCLVGFAGLRYAKPWLFQKEKTVTKVKTQEPPLAPVFPYTRLGTESPDPAQEAQQVPARQYTVEIAVLEQKDKATQLVRAFNDRGLKAYFTPYNYKGLVYFRVRLGVYGTEKDAQPALANARLLEPKAKITKL